MRAHWSVSLTVFLYVVATVSTGACQDRSAAQLPAGVTAVWDLSKAYRETTPTRERICINGLWAWQPVKEKSNQPPTGNWGYFKVPGPWPASVRGEDQTVYPHASWKDENLRAFTTAWYQREIGVPKDWTGRRIAVSAEYLNSYAAVYVDGKKAGEMHFPAGEVDITSLCRPGSKQVLSLQVVAMPLREALLSFKDTIASGTVKGTVARRGLCGDVFLVGTPSGARIADVKVDTSTRKGEITLDTALQDLAPSTRYALRTQITDKGRKIAEFTSKPFGKDDLKEGRIAVTEKWKAEKLWDVHTPQNMYDVAVSLLEDGNKTLDTMPPVRFGFREFWIDGRDFYLNGTRIFLSGVVLSNANLGASLATYEAAKEGMIRLKSFGISVVYTGNYGCEPGTHVSFTEVLRAADDVGMLIALSQPHFGQYDWKAADADQTNGYARHAEFYVRVAQNHPAVVFYATSHNATGYTEDMNPDLIDGLVNRDKWSGSSAKLALRAEAIIKHFDPGRVVYHHSSGNLGAMHTSNFYPNWAPIQELSDWFEHWGTEGVKPFFSVEYDAPCPWDWTLYRGWYKNKRSFGDAKAPWEFCLAEWNAQFLGDRAYQISEQEKKNLRWEAEQFRAGNVWGRFQYPYHLDYRLEERYPIYAMYLSDNLRAFRTWGMSVNSPTQGHSHFWTLRPGVNKGRKDLKVDWNHLQQPGISPDCIAENRESINLGFERSDWIPTAGADAIVRNNGPLLAYVGGKPAAFTSKDHNFLPGETVEKQLIIINNCRQTVSCDCSWSLSLPKAASGSKAISLPTGQQERIPLRFELPAGLAAGKYELTATVKFSNGETQNDSFTVNVMPQPAAPRTTAKIAIWDPKGETGKLLAGMGLKCQPVDANADLTGYDILVVGKAAMTVDGPGPDVKNVRSGLKVILFEQNADVLEKRFGFRVAEYGLRNVFMRTPDHPILAGVDRGNLHDWRGEATLSAPRLSYKITEPFGTPTVKWCDIPVTRVWRCGCRGNVASVLIEKPACGDFLPIIDGGFSLQYSPLMEYRDGKGMVLFCQMDVSGRTETDPAAERLVQNLIAYASDWKPASNRQALYAGDPAGKNHLEKTGVSAGLYEGGKPAPDQVLIVGPGSRQALSSNAAALGEWLKAGGRLLAIGLDQADISGLLPKVTIKKAEHIAAYFEPLGTSSLLAGIGPADVHNRDPKEFSLVAAGAAVVGDGILAKAESGNVVFCQLVPWQCDYSKERHNVKQTYRHASFLVTRLLGNMGVEGSTPLLARFHSPVNSAENEKRWLDGLYLDQPEEWDDPYRFFRW
jgi:beta-galactosidase